VQYEGKSPFMSHVTPYAFLMSFVARMVELAAAFSTEREERGRDVR
jgi:hypothetical protein